MRRDFVLPGDDMEWLDLRGTPYELVKDGNVLRVVLHEFSVPPGYTTQSVSSNVRIESGYPDAQIDMVYFYPALALSTGRTIRAISTDPFDGKTWQRWSRHRTPANPWRPGIDNLATHFAQVESWLQREAGRP